MSRRAGAPVALVNMPVFATDTPSLGLSLLKAGLAKHRIPCNVHYLNMWFAEATGPDLHRELLAWPQIDMLNEWIFSAAVWGSDPARDEDYIEKIIKGGDPAHADMRYKQGLPTLLQKLPFCRSLVDAYLKRCLTEIPWEAFRIVGFHSQFQQQMASLAMARRLKERHPDLFIVFGGSNARAEMGRTLLNTFPYIDAVCTGEGDLVFPRLASDVLKGRPPTPIIGVVRRGDPAESGCAYPTCSRMDELPYPQHDDFFHQRIKKARLCAEEFYLAMETSRGCWWGEKSQCTFCGLNKDEIRFRRKSVPRALSEIKWLLRKHGAAVQTMLFTDLNMPRGYLYSLLPQLIQVEPKPSKGMFFETRIALERKHVRLMKKAGLRSLQPGIESFSDSILKRMRKGTTGLQNIQFLKWCSQYGIRPAWNLIFGFPGERPEEYARVPGIIRAIVHLAPPVTIGRIRFDRYSPYFCAPAAFGIRRLRPFPSYSFIYPGVSAETLKDLVYFFTGDFDGQEKIESYSKELLLAVDEWLECYGNVALCAIKKRDQLVMCDFRPGAKENVFLLNEAQSRLYESCDQIQSRESLQRLLSAETRSSMESRDLDSVLAPLISRKYLLQDNDKYLALAVSLGDEFFLPEPLWPRIPEILEVIDSL